MILNMVINGTSPTKSTIIVYTSMGSTVSLYDSTYTRLIRTATERSSGEYWFTGLNNGIYYLKASLNNDSTTLTQTITEYGVYRVTMLYRTIPEFTYTGGTYEIVQDNDTVINNSDIPTYRGNWKIRFLTSGLLQFSNLQGAANGIDVFLVGGGGGGGSGVGNGGGGGGYTFTQRALSIATNTGYNISIGNGGAANSAGGKTTAFSYTAMGGRARGSNSTGYGGEGGSGGGAGTNSNSTSDNTLWRGGSNGSAGYNNGSLITAYGHGLGQKFTTREFGETTGKLYAGGGGAGVNVGSNGRVAQLGGAGGGGNGAGAASGGGIIQATAGQANTGGGGGGGGYNNASAGASGGSGIVVIRNARS